MVDKRGYHGTFHRRFKHLHRYVNEFADRHNIRDKDTVEQMLPGTGGQRLRYPRLMAPNWKNRTMDGRQPTLCAA